MLTELRFPGAIVLTVTVALLLFLIPISESLRPWKPEFIGLVFIHWALVMPHRDNLYLAFFTGLLLDTITNTILGQHALSLVVLTYFSIRLSKRMNPKILWQQISLIFTVLATYLLINLWIYGSTGNSSHSWEYWFPLFSSLLAWLILHPLMNHLYTTRKNL